MIEFIPMSRRKYFDKHDISLFPKTLKESESDGGIRFKSKLLRHVVATTLPRNLLSTFLRIHFTYLYEILFIRNSFHSVC